MGGDYGRVLAFELDYRGGGEGEVEGVDRMITYEDMEPILALRALADYWRFFREIRVEEWEEARELLIKWTRK